MFNKTSFKVLESKWRGGIKKVDKGSGYYKRDGFIIAKSSSSESLHKATMATPGIGSSVPSTGGGLSFSIPGILEIRLGMLFGTDY